MQKLFQILEVICNEISKTSYESLLFGIPMVLSMELVGQSNCETHDIGSEDTTSAADCLLGLGPAIPIA